MCVNGRLFKRVLWYSEGARRCLQPCCVPGLKYRLAGLCGGAGWLQAVLLGLSTGLRPPLAMGLTSKWSGVERRGLRRWRGGLIPPEPGQMLLTSLSQISSRRGKMASNPHGVRTLSWPSLAHPNSESCPFFCTFLAGGHSPQTYQHYPVLLLIKARRLYSIHLSVLVSGTLYYSLRQLLWFCPETLQ